MKNYSNGITRKNKVMQFFCKHKNIGTFEEQKMFHSLSGETVHRICRDCGKHMGKAFLEYEGMGYK